MGWYLQAGVALYSTACVGATAHAGYVRASGLGLFDDLTHLVPVLYMGAKTIASKVAEEGLNASLTCRPTRGSVNPHATDLAVYQVDTIVMWVIASPITRDDRWD